MFQQVAALYGRVVLRCFAAVSQSLAPHHPDGVDAGVDVVMTNRLFGDAVGFVLGAPACERDHAIFAGEMIEGVAVERVILRSHQGRQCQKKAMRTCAIQVTKVLATLTRRQSRRFYLSQNKPVESVLRVEGVARSPVRFVDVFQRLSVYDPAKVVALRKEKV